MLGLPPTVAMFIFVVPAAALVDGAGADAAGFASAAPDPAGLAGAAADPAGLALAAAEAGAAEAGFAAADSAGFAAAGDDAGAGDEGGVAEPPQADKIKPKASTRLGCNLMSPIYGQPSCVASQMSS
jgi:hypothetical protein